MVIVSINESDNCWFVLRQVVLAKGSIKRQRIFTVIYKYNYIKRLRQAEELSKSNNKYPAGKTID